MKKKVRDVYVLNTEEKRKKELFLERNKGA